MTPSHRPRMQYTQGEVCHICTYDVYHNTIYRFQKDRRSRADRAFNPSFPARCRRSHHSRSLQAWPHFPTRQ